MLWIITTLVFWGIWAVCQKKAEYYLGISWLFILSTIVSFPVDLYFARQLKTIPPKIGFAWGIFGCVCGIIGSLAYLKALKVYPKGSIVTMAGALYPIISIIIFTIMGETLTNKQAIGILLGIIATILMVYE